MSTARNGYEFIDCLRKTIDWLNGDLTLEILFFRTIFVNIYGKIINIDFHRWENFAEKESSVLYLIV